MHVLVVGGAGYIGSHMVKLLCQRGCNVTVMDNLSAGYRDAVLDGRFVLGDLGELDVLEELFQTNRFDGVMHFASHIQVGESVREPAKYYRNNVFKAQHLLDAMVSHRVNHFIGYDICLGKTVRTPNGPVSFRFGHVSGGLVATGCLQGFFVGDQGCRGHGNDHCVHGLRLCHGSDEVR